MKIKSRTQRRLMVCQPSATLGEPSANIYPTVPLCMSCSGKCSRSVGARYTLRQSRLFNIVHVAFLSIVFSTGLFSRIHIYIIYIPADTKRWINVGLASVQRRRWTNVKPTLIQRIVSAERPIHIYIYIYNTSNIIFIFPACGIH